MKLCIESGAFPTEWEKGNIVAIQGKKRQKSTEKLQSIVFATYLWTNSWKIIV